MPDHIATSPSSPKKHTIKTVVENDYIPSNEARLLDTAIDVVYAFVNLRAAVLTGNQSYEQSYDLSPPETQAYVAALDFLTKTLSQDPTSFHFFIKREEAETSTEI